MRGEDLTREGEIGTTRSDYSLMYCNHQDALRLQANAFMGVTKDSTRSAEDIISTPLPGETLSSFYARSREYPYLMRIRTFIKFHVQ